MRWAGVGVVGSGRLMVAKNAVIERAARAAARMCAILPVASPETFSQPPASAIMDTHGAATPPSAGEVWCCSSPVVSDPFAERTDRPHRGIAHRSVCATLAVECARVSGTFLSVLYAGGDLPDE